MVWDKVKSKITYALRTMLLIRLILLISVLKISLFIDYCKDKCIPCCKEICAKCPIINNQSTNITASTKYIFMHTVKNITQYGYNKSSTIAASEHKTSMITENFNPHQRLPTMRNVTYFFISPWKGSMEYNCGKTRRAPCRVVIWIT